MTQAFVYLAAALCAVPIANRLGLGSVLGYLLAGVTIGPFVLGFVGREGESVMHVAEFGVVMMLFLVGLELRPQILWDLRRTILGMGAAQVVLTAVVAAAGLVWLGVELRVAIAIGLIVSSSSTAIILQSLSEKGLLRSEGGQASFSVLLFQDIAVIPIIAFLPLLGSGEPDASAEHGSPLDGQPAWLQGIVVIAAVAAIVLGGRFLVRPVFRYLARTRQREVFTAAALCLVVGIALLMQLVGLSAALGTFVAGLVLAESEFRHELEGDIEPFKGLLLGLFFISVGAAIDFGLFFSRPLEILGLAAGLIALKMVVLYGLARAFGLGRPARWLFAFALAQGGEFAFVLASFAQGEHVLGAAEVGPLVLVVALSMLVTPLLLVFLERVVLPRVTERSAERPADEIAPHENPVIIAGFGRFGQIVARMMRTAGHGTTILDYDAEILEAAARVGMKVHYGDASRLELLHSAGCARAKVLVIAVDEREKAVRIAEAVKTHFPQLITVSRAWDRLHHYQLKRAGVTHVFRETFGSALEAGTASLRVLGMRAHRAHRVAQAYRAHDERSLAELEALWGKDEAQYFEGVRRTVEELERLLRSTSGAAIEEADQAFDNDHLRPDDEPPAEVTRAE